MNLLFNIIAVIISIVAIFISCKSYVNSTKALRLSSYNKKKEIYNSCVELLYDLRWSINNIHTAPMDFLKGKGCREFLGRIDGFENYFKGHVKD